MATYTELFNLRGNASLDPVKQKILVAISIKANALAKASPTAAQKTWALDALAHPSNYLDLILNYALADYSAASTATITGATDSQIQTVVDAAVTTLLSV